jgi:hypothetical protein
MPNFYYTDANGQKQGLITEQHLRALAVQGVITPNTPLETEGGHNGLAGQIPGLFDGIVPSFALPVPPVAPPPVNLFCTNCGNTVSDRAVACMSCGASPLGHKKFCRYCGVALNPEQIVCIKCGVSLSGNAGAGNYGARVTFHNSTDLTKRFNTYFAVFWIFAVVAQVCGIFLETIELMGSEEMAGLFALFLVVPVVITTLVFTYMLLYQLWKLIPLDIARTTPGKAVGFSFIPIFNFYWWFVAFWGLGKDMNETLYRRGIPYQVNAGLGLASCVLCIVSLVIAFPIGLVFEIPYATTLFDIATTITLIFFFKSVKDGAIAVLEQGA